MTVLSVSGRALSTSEVLPAQGRVIRALMLRDVKTRFGGSALGFLIAIAWPLTHSFAILAINSAVGRTIPYGDSGALWFGTGLIPFMAFNYMARFIMLGLVLNRNLLTFPVVKVMDILLARAVVELLSASLVVVLTLLIYYIIGIDSWPRDLPQAFWALGACMLLGLGFGIINGILAAAFPFWVTGYALMQITMWIASGVLFVPDALPEQARYWLSFNPALQGIEWMRSAYYDGYGSQVLDRTYMIEVAVFTLCLGLVMERLLRGKIL